MIKLIKLIINREKSQEDYAALQNYFAKKTLEQLNTKGIQLDNKKVLELASGQGGYSRLFNQASKEFLATDQYEGDLFQKEQIPFILMDVSKPFALESNNFDFIFCISLIEHLSDPRPMLSEAYRVLKPGGTLYLSFPPFYTLFMNGGHIFKPFHFLGEKAACKICNLLKKRPYELKGYYSYPKSCGLYPLKIDQVTQLLADNGFDIQETFTKMTSINTTYLPGIIKDLLTWHACYLAKKPYEH